MKRLKKKKKKKKSQAEVPVDPTDQVMLRLKLLDAFIDISRFLLAFRMIGTEDTNKSDDITKQTHWRSKEIVEILFGNCQQINLSVRLNAAAHANMKYLPAQVRP